LRSRSVSHFESDRIIYAVENIGLIILKQPLNENATDFIIGGHPMWQQEFIWFFTIFPQEFRKNNRVAFEVLIGLAVVHLFGFHNPKQLADLHVDTAQNGISS
jgi:hypothetical protein